MTEPTPFELSRIYAKGWSEGRRSDIDLDADDFAAAVAALNPYTLEAERERWAAGFQDAVKRAHGPRGGMAR